MPVLLAVTHRSRRTSGTNVTMPRLGSGTPCTSHCSSATHNPPSTIKEVLLHAITREVRPNERGARLFCWRAFHPAPEITVVTLRRFSNRVLSGGLYRGPRTSLLRNKAVCKDAVCSFAYRRTRSDHLTTAMPPSTGPPQPMRLDLLGKSLQTEQAVLRRPSA